MSVKLEFIKEFDPVSKLIVYFTQKDGMYVSNSISADKDKAYDMFLNIASNVETKPLKEVVETIFKLA